jgi:hypothetical protein
MKVRFSFIFSLLMLVGCTGTPPMPQFPTGPLQGTLQHGVYHDMRNWFGVEPPIGPDDPDYPTLAVNEEYEAHISFVTFVLSRSPGEFYRAYVEDFAGGDHAVPNLDVLGDAAMNFFGKQVVEQRTEPLRFIAQRRYQAGKTYGLLRLYTERTPIEPLLANLGMGEDYTAYILMYVTELGGKVGMVWVEWPVDCKLCTPVPRGPAATGDDQIDRALALDGRAGAFMASFRFGKD